MISLEVTDKPDKNWDNRLLQTFQGTVYQTQECANAAKLLGNEPLFLKFLNNKGKIVGQLMIISHKRFEKKGKVGKILRKIPIIKNTIFRWTYGPVIFDDNFLDDICNELSKFLISKKVIVIGSEPALSDGILSTMGKPFVIKNWSTFLVDLTLDLKTLWEKMDKHSARKNIERSKKRGIIIKEMNKSDLKTYRKMGFEIGKINQESSLHTAEKWWDELSQVGMTGFLAFDHNIPVGAILVSSFNNYINEWGIIRTKRDTSLKLYSQDFLKWKIIEWGIENKFKYFDLTGVNPNPSDSKESGIYRYKKKWGGKLINFNMITLGK